MHAKSDQITAEHVTTEDLAFSAYLKMKGHRLIKSERKKSISAFTFETGSEDADLLKMEFVNSEFLSFYNELRNLKKLI